VTPRSLSEVEKLCEAACRSRSIRSSSGLERGGVRRRLCGSFGEDAPDLRVAGGTSCTCIRLSHDAADCRRVSLIAFAPVSGCPDFRTSDLQTVADDLVVAGFVAGC